jgi:two-component system, OmpR family, heavy metal sensor histidine kinase CusS
MHGLRIRWKLTLWYGGVLAVVLGIFGAVVFLMMRQHLMQRIDQGLHEELGDVLSEVKRATSPESLKDWLDRRFAAHAGFDFQITRSDGERFFYNARLADQAWPLPSRNVDSPDPICQSIPLDEKGLWRIVQVRVQGPDGPLTVQVGRSLAAYTHELNELLMTFLLAGPISLLAAVSGGYFLACRALRPVQQMVEAARDITADRLNQRITVSNPHDELGELGQTLNQMIEGLDRSFTEMRRFTADAAHELRTPLAIIRNEAEVALRLPRSDEQYRGVLENLLEDTNRLSVLADQLLFLSRQEAGLGDKRSERIDVHATLQDVIGNMQLMAQDKGIEIEFLESPHCEMHGDARLLRRVFVNLLDNAIKFTDRGGKIQVSCEGDADEISIRFLDTGVGIAPEHLPHVFERFYRVDAARSGNGQGTGLGLAICQSIIRGFSGTLDVESSVGVGSTFTIRIPQSQKIPNGSERPT